jgi:sugar phosphate isomerase/epimerase
MASHVCGNEYGIDSAEEIDSQVIVYTCCRGDHHPVDLGFVYERQQQSQSNSKEWLDQLDDIREVAIEPDINVQLEKTGEPRHLRQDNHAKAL